MSCPLILKLKITTSHVYTERARLSSEKVLPHTPGIASLWRTTVLRWEDRQQSG